VQGCLDSVGGSVAYQYNAFDLRVGLSGRDERCRFVHDGADVVGKPHISPRNVVVGYGAKAGMALYREQFHYQPGRHFPLPPPPPPLQQSTAE